MQGEGYCECGCGEKTELCPGTIRSIGWVKGEPKRFIHGHQSRKPGPKYEVAENGCWLWLGYVSKKGYAEMRPHGSKNMARAHRWYYEQAKGPIPKGMQLDHLCRNRACVNPDHLEPVTNFENQRRGRRPKLSEEAVREIRNTPSTYGSVAALARKFDVDPSTIHRVRSGKSWHLLE